jgi:hypothetical protein
MKVFRNLGVYIGVKGMITISTITALTGTTDPEVSIC